MTSFEIARAAGADMKLADSRCAGDIPKLIYAASTDPNMYFMSQS